jgi:uncharacterized membrane protein (DUF485 family)
MSTMSIPGASPPGPLPAAPASAARHQKLLAGACTALVAVTFLGFLLISAWPPAWVSMPLSDGTPVTWALAIGLALPVLYFVVVVAYIVYMNRHAVSGTTTAMKPAGVRDGQ